MKLLFDLFPVILFFATFKVAQTSPEACLNALTSVFGGSFDVTQVPILAATLVAIVASLLQVALVFARGKKPEPMLWISLAVIVVFGSLTIILKNELFIKWKPTILYWIFGAILLFGCATGRNFMAKLFKKELKLPAECWKTMQEAWCVFFFLVGIINLLVAYLCSTETWVNFKLFGLLGLTLLFTIGFGVWLTKKLPRDVA